MKNILYIISLLLTISGFFLDRAEQYPFIVKIIDEDFYHTKQALDPFYLHPKFSIAQDNPAFDILCKKYFDNEKCKNAIDIRRTGMHHFLGNVSEGSGFYLVLNYGIDSVQAGPLFNAIKDREHEEFNKRIGSWGRNIFWLGIILGIIKFIMDNKNK